MADDGKVQASKAKATDATDAPMHAPPGLRERHKLDKLERISSAAIRLFGRDGFDAATVRDIAREADVALGTLSLYARDKRDLILMIFNRVIPPMMDEGRRTSAVDAPLLDNMVGFFTPFYRAYAGNVTLYRIVLGQIYNGAPSRHAERNDAIRVELIGLLARMIDDAKVSGECRGEIDPEVHARLFFYIYFAAVRVWIFQSDPDPKMGLEDLRTLFQEHAAGVLA